MQGRRIHDDKFKPGDYGLVDGVWYGCTPNGHLGNLASHEVVEHDDGTITVSPSILVSDTKGNTLWHGYLDHGDWIEI